jgi:hypothetical protein
MMHDEIVLDVIYETPWTVFDGERNHEFVFVHAGSLFEGPTVGGGIPSALRDRIIRELQNLEVDNDE